MSGDNSWTVAGITASYRGNPTTITLTRGSTSTIPLVFEDDTAYSNILDYLDYSPENVVQTGTTHMGEPWFRETIPAGSPVDSYVVDVETGTDVVDPRDLWAVVVGGADISKGHAYHAVELELFVLARLSEYPDRSSVVDAYGDTRGD